AGQAVAAGAAEAEDADRFGLLRPHPVGAGRVRLLGVRRRPAAGAAPVVELSQGRRRRHHPGHAVPLALRGRQPVRRSEERIVPGRDAHSATLGRERPAVCGHRRRCGLRDLRDRPGRHRALQQLVVRARAPRRPADAAGRRHARLGRGRSARLPHAAAREHAQAGLEPRPAAADRLRRRMAGSARQRRVRQCVQGAVGVVHPPRGRGRAVPVEPARRRQGRATGRSRPAIVARAALGRPRRAAGLTEAAMPTLTLPATDGALRPFTLSAPRGFPQRAAGPFNRIAYSAAHVVADPLSTVDPWIGCAIDWDTTIAYRNRLWTLGLGVAEAMDTAQRGMGLDWPTSLELIRRSIDAARDHPGALVASGCGTDHVAPDPSLSVDDVIAAYESQMAAIEALGGRLILMASRALAACARSPDDYGRVYDRLLSQVREPVIIHWL